VNEGVYKLVLVLSIVFYVLVVLLIFIFAFFGSYLHVDELFRFMNPFYLWIIFFLVSLGIIPYFVVIKNDFKLLGEELYQEKTLQLHAFALMLSVVPAMWALFNIIFTGNLTISVILLIYGVLFGIIASYTVKKS
jgi:hypothetical protein